ncbi:MAG TPA: cyclase family protein [Methanofastidiosum sp.]|nr:cyclase family protein [Methanofastidiosum sp.]HPA49182.1 cyclase family protein [Methanofastidiosum sp.]HQK62408.1 cyclase family protein [Methanofastidiosum sp.]HQM94641.1 cyclase family protein [Methanofastidiosum sp.]HQQ48640.1 cyclase family protein [Methanofastidiosum sp.]
MLIDVSLKLKEGMVFRGGSPPFSITSIKCYHENEGEYSTSIINTPAHIGTHIDTIVKDNLIEVDRLIGRGVLIDISNVKESQILMEHINNPNLVKKGDFVFFKTNWSNKIESNDYYNHPELSFEVLDFLVGKGINMVGIDALGLGKGKNHGIYDRYLASKGVFIIENLTNLDLIKKESFMVYCFPLSVENLEAIPARVVVDV